MAQAAESLRLQGVARLAGLLAAAVLLTLGSAMAQTAWPGATWETVSPAQAGLNNEQLMAAREYALSGGGSGFITRNGKLVLSWGDEAKLYDLKSTTKSIGFTAMGLAMLDGKLSLSDRAADCHPQFAVPPEQNRQTRWRDQIRLLPLATHTAGFEKPGGYAKLLFPPGTKWAYSDGGPNWLAECTTLAYRGDIEDLLFERVFNHLNITRDDLRWRTHRYRDAQLDGIARREFGSGVNVRAPSIEKVGQGPAGLKASGMLMVDGVLYMWIRNAANSLLAWSEDHDKTWQEADWRLVSSFGAPTFLNFGKNYRGARDHFVYVSSHDHDSAYEPADRMVLARVSKTLVRDKAAYQYFAGLDASGRPRWRGSADARAGVFEHPGRVYRSGITYNAGLERYLWCQIIPGSDTRFLGRVRRLRRPRALGPLDHRLLHRAMGRRPRRDVQLPDQVDELRRQDHPHGLLRRRLVLGSASNTHCRAALTPEAPHRGRLPLG